MASPPPTDSGDLASVTTPAAVAPIADRRRWFGSSLLKTTPAWLVSLLAHVVVLLTMAMVVHKLPKPDAPRLITAGASEVAEDVTESEDQIEIEEAIVTDQPMAEVLALPSESEVQDMEVVADANDLDAARGSLEMVDIAMDFGAASDLLAAVGTLDGAAAGFGARTSAALQSERIRSSGGDPQLVNRVVEESLKWMLRHQLDDGGWSFDCTTNPNCRGQCDNPELQSHLNDRVAATSLSLWPMLAKGYTHKGTGELARHKIPIENGLAFLARNVLEGRGNAYHRGGDMYSQALTAVVLSEAYGMTHDQRLLQPAQLALNFIMEAQDPSGGGWRYRPKEPGDTSSVAWQLVALKSGNLSGLGVNPLVIKRATRFLDSVASDDGAAYGYNDATTPRPSLNAAGLLCRIFTGWKQDNDALRRGAMKLAQQGPTSDIYSTYYATQVLFHLQKQLPQEWHSWQTSMTEMLVKAQATSGHRRGSYFDGMDTGHAARVGGRLYVTSMATMTMEVYFKLGVMYSPQSAEEFVE